MKGQRIDTQTALRIKELRLQWGLTYKQISERLGVACSTAHDYSGRITFPEMLDRLEGTERDRFLLYLQSRLSKKLLDEAYENCRFYGS